MLTDLSLEMPNNPGHAQRNLVVPSITNYVRKALSVFGVDIVKVAKKTRVVSCGMIANVEHDGKQLRFFVENPKDHIQRHHFEGELYELFGLSMIKKHLPKNGTYVDVGANVGNHTIFVSKLLEPKRIFAFEPASLQYMILSINVAINEVSELVSLYKLGLSDKSTCGRMITPSQYNIGRTRLSDDASGEEVTLIKGDEILSEVDVDLIKIDVEGHEMAALRGMKNTIINSKPIIIVELDRKNTDQFFEFLDIIGYGIIDRHKEYPNSEYIVASHASRKI